MPDRYDQEQTTAWATGAALAVSPACRAAVGRWDESFFLYSEETDYALRAADAGFAVRYTPASVVAHVGGDQGRAPRLWALSAANRVELHRRRHGRLAGSVLRRGRRWSTRPPGPVGTPLIAPPCRPWCGAAGAGSVAVAAAAGRDSWVCFSGQDWWCHNRAHSDFQLMTRVARAAPRPAGQQHGDAGAPARA